MPFSTNLNIMNKSTRKSFLLTFSSIKIKYFQKYLIIFYWKLIELSFVWIWWWNIFGQKIKHSFLLKILPVTSVLKKKLLLRPTPNMLNRLRHKQKAKAWLTFWKWSEILWGNTADFTRILTWSIDLFLYIYS